MKTCGRRERNGVHGAGKGKEKRRGANMDLGLWAHIINQIKPCGRDREKAQDQFYYTTKIEGGKKYEQN